MPVLKAKALDNRLPDPILGDRYAERVMRRLDPGYDRGRGATQLGLVAVIRSLAHDTWACVTDLAWLDRIPRDRPLLLIAEGLVPYLTEADVRRLLTTVVDALPGGQLQFD